MPRSFLILWLSHIGIIPWSDKPVSLTDDVKYCHEVLTLSGYDSAFTNPVFFCQEDRFYYYMAELRTTVCLDTLCRIAVLKVYWDLTGQYTRFDTLPGLPLTKNDHQPFSSKDYRRLHKTLADEGSILGGKSKEELLSQEAQRYSEKIDGWTGATLEEIKSVVVEGALYSTHTLWHLINGAITHKIKAHTLTVYDSTIERQLLGSKNPDAVILALERWGEEAYVTRFGEIAGLLKRGDIRINFYIAQNLPRHALDEVNNKKEMQEAWPYLDEYSQSIMPSPF